EDSLGFEGDDGNEDTDPVTPHLRAMDAVNPNDRCFAEARAAGVTTVVTGPGSSNPIAGQMCALKTVGARVDDMLLRAPLAIKLALGENPKTVYHGKNQAPVTRMATVALIREAFLKAQKYLEQKGRADEDSDFDPPEFDIKSEALLPALTGEIPVHIHAHRQDDMFSALRIAAEFNLRPVMVHGTEGHLIAEVLARESVPVLCGPNLCDRSKPELSGLDPAAPGNLSRAGVKIALITDHPVIPSQYLNLCAGLAIREGLDSETALRALTADAAEICGLASRVGSLEPGKDADFSVWSGDPFTLAAKPFAVAIDGVWIG
ncbi:MAG: amidohydrolase, partial [Oscillospiraceae bacterium]|nr:amidohydrolase [Oscillospiraceae bacterium]